MKLNFKKIIELGLYLLVFFLPWQTRLIVRAGEINGGYSEYGTISLYGTDIPLIVLLGLFITWKLREARNSKAAKHPIGCLAANPEIPESAEYSKRHPSPFAFRTIWITIALLDLFVFLSIFAAPDKTLALYRYGVFLLGIGLFWLVTSAVYDRRKLVWAFVAGACLQAVLGIWQFLTQTTFASKWLGLALHQAGELGVSVVETAAGERWLRAYGGLDHPNMLGGYLTAAVMLAALAYLIRPADNGEKGLLSGKTATASSVTDRQSREGADLSVLLALPVTGLLSAAVFFSFSRSAWLGLALGLAVVSVLTVLKKDWQGVGRIMRVGLVSGITLFVLLNLFGGLVWTRFAPDTRLESKSLDERRESVKEALPIIKSRWFSGTGIGNYPLAVSKYSRDGEEAWRFQPVHNVLLLAGAEIGSAGLAVFLVLLFLVLYFSLKSCRGRAGYYCYLTGLWLALAFMMLFDHWWWSLHLGVLLFWLLMGWIVVAVKEGPPES